MPSKVGDVKDDWPFVSFLTTAYQTEQYVSETIESVVNQTTPDWELIVVDNGMSEAMASIVGKYTVDPRIKLVRQCNKGYVGGVSAAAAMAVGRYLCVLDSDDKIEPSFCARMKALVDVEPTIDGAGCNATTFSDPDDAKGLDFFRTTGRRSQPNPSYPVSFAELLEDGTPPYVGVVRRQVWDALDGYCCSPELEPDVALWLRLVSAGHDLRILPDQLVRTRIRPGSLSNHPANNHAFQQRMQQSYVEVARAHGLDEDAIARTGMLRRLRYHHYLSTAGSALSRGDVKAARAAALGAIGQQPTVRAAIAVGATHLGSGLVGPVREVKRRTLTALNRMRMRLRARRRFGYGLQR